MKVLVTGGAGYIGSILCPMLLHAGHEVLVIDNFRYKQTSLLDLCLNESFTVIRGDVRDKSLISEAVKSVDAIIPLACLTGAPISSKYPDDAKTINHDAVKTLYELKSKDQLFIFPSTNSGYGIGQNDIFCDENTPMNPISLYGKLKVELESWLLDQGNCVTFRLATVFGASPRMRQDLLVNDFVYKAVHEKYIELFEPNFKRNFLHIRDAAGVFLHTIDNYQTMKGSPYNVGLSNANLSKLELCEKIQKQIPTLKIEISDKDTDPDKRDYIVCNKRIEGTGFKTEVTLEYGIRELIQVFKIITSRDFKNI